MERADMSAITVTPRLTLSVLDAYFGDTSDMMTYLAERLELMDGANSISEHLFRDGDSPSYRAFVSRTYIASKTSAADNGGKRLFKAYPPMMYMREIIDKAQEKLFAKAKGRSSNIITSGYRTSSRNGDVGKRGMTRMGITNYFVNTIVTALKAPEWETLFERVGVDAMLHLLTEVSVFVSLPNQCLCQMTGEPLIHLVPSNSGIIDQRPKTQESCARAKPAMKRKAAGYHRDERPTKRLRSFESVSSVVTADGTGTVTAQPTLKVAPADIYLTRVRLFYARPARVPHQNHIIVGLPPKHILNRLNPSYHRKPKLRPEDFVDLDVRTQAEHARHLAKYVFPRQYGLSNVLDLSAQSKGSMKVPDFVDRESEIKDKGACRTPKRLKEILSLVEKMIWRHGKCGYKPLRDKACPSKIKSEDAKSLDSSVILELMSERSIQLRSQLALADASTSVDSVGWPIVSHGPSQAERHVKNKPRFAEFACSHTEVYRYAVLVTKAVIPKAFWGSDRNFKNMLGHVKTFISCRRYETMTLHHILQGFSTSECDWLMPPGQATQRQSRVSVTDALKRRELLEEFIFWYFTSFLLQLLKTTFYVTETSAFRNQVLYFRHDDWETLCAPLVDRLTSETFEKMPQSEAEELLRQRKLGFSFVRLLPKETGVRPIVNLRRRKPTKPGAYGPAEQSINQILQAAFHILTFEKQAQPKHLGASVFGPNEVYTRLKAFKSRLTASASGSLPKLYFVKLDVQACFDTIEQTKLLEILRELISEDTYMVQRYGQVSSMAGKIQRKYVKKAFPEDDHPHFLEYAAKLASSLRHTIFVDQVVYTFSQKQDILQLLEEHITENIVKIGQDYYRQVVGIPQGSVLSALLCSFFYGDLEKRFFKFSEDPQSALFRLIDDYLFITTSLPKARNFLDMMNGGHPEYGCLISKDKTLTNFDHDAQIMNVTGPQQQRFPWCGFLIDMTDLSVSTDYSRYHGNCLQDSLTVNKGRRPGTVFIHKMLQQTKFRSHIIYCDSDLNSERTVYLNIYQNFVLVAMKMHLYIRDWGISTKSSKFIRDSVHQVIRYAYSTMRNKASNKVARTSAGKCDIEKDHVIWLGTHAFHAVLSRKALNYPALLRYLAFELTLSRHKRSRKRFRTLVREGLISMAQISF